MNYDKYNNFLNSFKIKLFIVLFLIKIIEILCISSGANEAIPDNPLQLIAKDCSMQMCIDRNGLSLWLSLQNVCSGTSANPYFLEINSNETIIDNIYSPIVVGSLCAMSSIISLFIGYNYAYFYNNNRNKYFLLKN